MNLGAALSGALSGAGSGAMIGGVPGALVGAGVGAAVSLFADAEAEKDEKKKAAILQQARDAMNSIPLPEERALVVDQLKSAGLYTPEMAGNIKQADTEYAKIQLDPRMKEAQMSALSQLQDLGKSGGLDQMDKANIEAARQRYAAESASQQAGVTESMQRRGMAGAGMEAVQRRMSAQGAANQMANQEAQIQGEARRRALDAMMKAGQLGGDIRGQEYDEQAKKAQAQDIINASNIAALRKDVDVKNQAQQVNLGNQQDILNKMWAENQRKNLLTQQAPQQAFTNQMTKATGQLPMVTAQAGMIDPNASKQAGANVLTGLAQGAAGYSAQQNADRNYDLDKQKLDLDKQKQMNASLYGYGNS